METDELIKLLLWFLVGWAAGRLARPTRPEP